MSAYATSRIGSAEEGLELASGRNTAGVERQPAAATRSAVIAPTLSPVPFAKKSPGSGSWVHRRYRVQLAVTRPRRRIYAGDVSGTRLCLNGANA